MFPRLCFLFFALAATTLCGTARAAIIFERIVDGVGYDDLRITLTEDITFTLTTANTSNLIFVLRDVIPSTAGDQQGNLSLNLQAYFNDTTSATTTGFNVGTAFPLPNINSTDAYFNYRATFGPSEFTYATGDTFTVKAGYTLTRNWFSEEAVLPSSPSTVQLLGNNYAITSTAMTIPEPSAAILIGCGLAALWLQRRGKKSKSIGLIFLERR